MQALLDVIVPVFLVIGAGYAAVWARLITNTTIDGLMQFTQGVAIPCLLFRALWTLDLGQNFDPWLLLAFYSGSVTGFVVGVLGAHYLFHRDAEDCVAIGFCCLFANSLMLGLALTERAYGSDALGPNYIIVALHSPVCYGIGITAMETLRARGSDPKRLPVTVLKAMFRNNLIVGIVLGLVFNVTSISLPSPMTDALDMVIRTALPVALFAMGGVLCRYRPEGDTRVIAFICLVSLGMHPAITYTLGHTVNLSDGALRSAVVTAAMAPGINAYVFANMYGRARRVAASSVLVAPGLSTLTAWLWLSALP
ncbi:MAG: AEC family transporter [Paracoccaceae bacterium]